MGGWFPSSSIYWYEYLGQHRGSVCRIQHRAELLRERAAAVRSWVCWRKLLMSHARAGLGSQWAQFHPLFWSRLNMATVTSAWWGWGPVLGAPSNTGMRERLCAEQPGSETGEWRCSVELCMLRWADLQGQALCFWTCTHPAFTQTFHVNL